MITNPPVAAIYSYFTEHHLSENDSTQISEVAVELLRLSKIMFSDHGFAEKLPKSEILFLAEVILQMGGHGIPGFDPRRVNDAQYKIMYEATYSLVHSVMRHPTMSMTEALLRPTSATEKGMTIDVTRRALMNVLNDRRRGVIVKITFD